MTNGNQTPPESPSCCGGGSCCSGPGKWIWIVLVVAVAGVLIAKMASRKGPAGMPTVEPARHAAIPRLVDLGAGKCIPCKMMAPILEELKHEYADTFKVELIDVWKDQEPGRRYGIRVIPTQIFFDAGGKELFRHEGFMSKEDILAKWKELGIELGVGAQ